MWCTSLTWAIILHKNPSSAHRNAQSASCKTNEGQNTILVASSKRLIKFYWMSSVKDFTNYFCPCILWNYRVNKNLEQNWDFVSQLFTDLPFLWLLLANDYLRTDWFALWKRSSFAGELLNKSESTAFIVTEETLF